MQSLIRLLCDSTQGACDSILNAVPASCGHTLKSRSEYQPLRTGGLVHDRKFCCFIYDFTQNMRVRREIFRTRVRHPNIHPSSVGNTTQRLLCSDNNHNRQILSDKYLHFGSHSPRFGGHSGKISQRPLFAVRASNSTLNKGTDKQGTAKWERQGVKSSTYAFC